MVARWAPACVLGGVFWSRTYGGRWFQGAHRADSSRTAVLWSQALVRSGRTPSAYGRSSHPDGLGTRVDIWRTRVDGVGDRRLARGWLPEWSPNGRLIAYVAGGIGDEGPIALMDAKTGKRIRHLAAKAGWLDWSPDGRWLLYSRNTRAEPGFPDLFAIRADGRGAARRLTRSRSQFEPRAIWSPDGNKIAFVRSRLVPPRGRVAPS